MFHRKQISPITMMLLVSSSVMAQWEIELDNAMYYTDDVGLFSVTRRLSLEEDPTQPVVDEAGQGSDFVYEPNLVFSYTDNNDLGELLIRADAGAYIFVDKTAYTHGFYQFQLAQLFTSATRVKFFYDLIPDLLIGFNHPDKQHGHSHPAPEFEERLTSHIWTLHLDQKIDDQLNVRLLTRYGLRNYEPPFEHRDTEFWTIGTHLEWELHPGIELMLGYHYEPGSADHQRQTQFHDDISYINHYFSAELSFALFRHWSINLIFDFEHNDFTSQNVHDFHYQAYENIYQGEIEMIYHLNHNTEIILGWQHGRRKFNFEQQTVKNNNIWLEVEMTFPL